MPTDIPGADISLQQSVMCQLEWISRDIHNGLAIMCLVIACSKYCEFPEVKL